jgi:hypothetical protein
VFCYTLWHFYAFSETNLLTRCHSASSLFFCYFCVSEKLHRKYSRNWMKQKSNLLFFQTRVRIQSRDGGGPGPGHTLGRRGPGLGRATRGEPPGPPPDAALPPIYSPRQEKPKPPINFPQNILHAATIVDARSGGSRSSYRHPAGEGNHRRRPSSSPWSPPE